jgi:tetratricopeptide (TPR) repeat protein
MKYHCVQCNEVFTPDASDDKPRCPKCLRQHGLRPVEAAKSAGPRKRWLAPIAVTALLVAAGSGAFVYHKLHTHAPGQVPLTPVDPEDLRADVRVLAGIDAGDLVQLLHADASVSAFAERAAKGQSTPEAKAKAIVAAIGARKRTQAFVEWPRVDAREGPPLTASATLAAIAKDGARRQLYPLELSALAVASLRSLGVPALIAEVYRYPDERGALDPSGRLGYHAVFLPAASPGGAGHVFDAYAGRTTLPVASDYIVLNDAQALAAAFAIRGLDRLDNALNGKAGLADTEAAVKLSPSSASVRGARAKLLLATGGIDSGTRELDASLQLRNDAARHNNVAVLALVRGDPNAGAKELASALEQLPDYALGHLTLATVHLMRGEFELARAEIEKAERLEPDLPQLPQIWAELYASNNDMDQALVKAQEAVRRRPKDPQARIILARIDRAAGRYDDMRTQARAIMTRAPADEQERMKSLVLEMLGPTALEDNAPVDAPANDTSAAVAPSPSGDNAEPARLDPGGLQLQPGASKLHLGAGDSKFKLDLHP